MTSPSSRTARIVTTVKPEKILIAMSGGVDSSVAALLLSEAGCECVGCDDAAVSTMRTPGCRAEQSCCSSRRRARTRAAWPISSGCRFMCSISQTSFGEQVMDRFVDAYERRCDAEPLHRLQPLHEVRQALSNGRSCSAATPSPRGTMPASSRKTAAGS